MKPEGWVFLCVLALWPQATSAQHGGGSAPLTETQKMGRLLYEQSCGVCHSKPTLVSPVFGPVLSQATLEGREELISAFIANGSARKLQLVVPYSRTRKVAVMNLRSEGDLQALKSQAERQ